MKSSAPLLCAESGEPSDNHALVFPLRQTGSTLPVYGQGTLDWEA